MKRLQVILGFVVCLTVLASTGWTKGFFKVGEVAPLFSLTSVTGQQVSLDDSICSVLQNQDVSHSDFISGCSSHSGVVGVVVHDVDHHVVALVGDVWHFEFIMSSFVATISEPCHVFAFNPDVWATKFFREAGHFFERCW